MYRLRLAAFAASCCFVTVSSAQTATVTFTGTVANSCVIASTNGGLKVDAAGTTLSSEEAGVGNSIMTVIATGATPQIQFTAPVLTGPAGFATGAATTMIAYTSPGGAAQAYTAANSSYTINRLLDTVTVKAKATNATGFAGGSYTISSTVTCSQP